MAAPGDRYPRKPGTGTVLYRGSKWLAFAPRLKGQKLQPIGQYDFRHQAEKAIATWLAMRQAAACSAGPER